MAQLIGMARGAAAIWRTVTRRDTQFVAPRLLKVRLTTRLGELVHEGEIPPINPPPEVILWGPRVFVHGLAHHPNARVTEWPETYIEGTAFSFDVWNGEPR